MPCPSTTLKTLPIMHLKTRPRILSFALKTLYGAVAGAVFLSSAASAAGLGKLTVLSALGQPLRAEIELTAVSAEEANGLVAKLAPADAFRAANIEFNPALMSLRFAVQQRNGRQYIQITSSQPVNEPFVDMLLELSWNSGRLVREYTFLLDPAELRATQPAQVAAAPVAVPQNTRPTPTPTPARPSSQASQEPSQPAPQAAQPTRPKVERAESSRAPTVDATEYKVKSGDTLGGIAARLKPAEISLDMMLVALYRANPDAFIGNNMNRLKSGQILSVPDSDAIKGGSDSEARGVVVAHAADFNAYRNKLAGQVASAAPSKTPEATQSAAGKITAKVEERPTAANESKDQLKLSKAGAGGGATGKSAALEAEDKIAKERALADATARVKELEKNVNDLEKLMVVKSKAGTEASKTAMAEIAPATPAAPATVVTPAPAAQPPAAAVPAPVKPKRIITTPPPPPEPSLADTLMDNINYIGAGLAIALLALFGLSRRKKKDAVAPTEPSILGAPTDQAQSMFAETGGQSVDTSNSVFNSSFAPSASQLDTNEVDPVAEADVYIAYGRDAQAEEILKEALRTHPERMPVRLKLLEIYAARKDQRSFETQAGEMYGLTKGQGEDWAQAAALGMTIDPANPLYASAGAAAPAVPSTPEAIAEQAILSQMHEEGVSTEPDAMDLTFADSEPTALPEPVQAAAAPADDHTLDFDLGGLSFEPITDEPAPTPAPAPVAAALEANPHEMEFTSEPIAAAAPPAEPEPSFDMAFDMDFDAPPAAATQAVEEKALDDIKLDFSSHAELPAEIHMADPVHSFDLPTLPEAAPAAEAHPLADLDAMNFDLPMTPAAAPAEDPFALPELPEAAPSFAASPTFTAAPQFDMSGIDLDLPSDSLPVLATEELAPIGQVDLSASHMEMETKLDLAIAYQEIGDKEGARELLDEVIKGGSADQVSKANDMRAKLA